MPRKLYYTFTKILSKAFRVEHTHTHNLTVITAISFKRWCGNSAKRMFLRVHNLHCALCVIQSTVYISIGYKIITRLKSIYSLVMSCPIHL